MNRQFKFLFSINLLLFFVFAQNNAATAQRRRAKTKPKPAAAARNNDPEYLATLELLQGAKIYQLIAQMQIALAEAYLENRTIGERKAKIALAKIDAEQRKNPSSAWTNFGQARSYAIWSDYLFNRNDFGKNAVSDKTVLANAEIIRKAVEKGLSVNPNFALLVASRANLRSVDCRIGKFSSEQDCYTQPLSELNRAIALAPDESEIITMRAELYEKQKQTATAEQDRERVKRMENAFSLKVDLNKQDPQESAFQMERGEAATGSFVQIVLLMLDENIKEILANDETAATAFRTKLFEYYETADKNYAAANRIKPAAHNLTRRGMLRLDVGTFAKTLRLQNATDAARKNFEEALGFFNEAIKLDPQFADAYDLRSQVYRETGEDKLAEADKQKALSLQKK